jgi:hypothetical protein
LGVVSTVLLTAGVTPQAVTAKKHGGKNKGCKNATKHCRQEFLENCHDSDVDNSGACTDAINQCCKKCKGKSENQLFDTCADVLCDFKDLC